MRATGKLNIGKLRYSVLPMLDADWAEDMDYFFIKAVLAA